MDALVLALMLLVALLVGIVLILLWVITGRGFRERETQRTPESALPSTLQDAELKSKLQRVLELLSSNPGVQGQMGEERLELILSTLPRRFWLRQPLLSNGNRPDYLLQLGGELKVPLDSKLLGVTDLMEGGSRDPTRLERRVEQAAREVAQRYLDPSQPAPLALLVLPPGTHALLGAGTLQRLHDMGVVPTPAEGVAALALLLPHLASWLPREDGSEPVPGLAATRRALLAALELLERSGRQGRNSNENLERARQVLEGARVRLEAGETQRIYGGRTPPLDELPG